VQEISSGLVYNRKTHLFNGNITLTNTGDSDLTGPVQVVLKDLPAGATLSNADGTTTEGNPFIDIDGLASGQALTQAVQFYDPNLVPINYTVQVLAGAPAQNPLEQFLAPGALSLVGVNSSGFNPVSAPLQFQLSQGQFLQDLAQVDLKINGIQVPSSKLMLAATTITTTSVLVDGRNDVSLSAVDTQGRPLYLSTTIWAGTHTRMAPG
jgi:hypothetical protein